jgi:hypothetical protein
MLLVCPDVEQQTDRRGVQPFESSSRLRILSGSMREIVIGGPCCSPHQPKVDQSTTKQWRWALWSQDLLRGPTALDGRQRWR